MVGKWQPYILGAEDDWSEVTDSGQRKRIQNRLAQRARRANLKARRNRTDSISGEAARAETQTDTPETLDGVMAGNDVEDLFEILGWGNQASESLDVVLDTPSSVADAQLNNLQPGLNAQFLLLTSLTTVAAFSSNATLLRLPCEVPIIDIFNPSHASLPSTLMPTELQKAIPHPPFIDVVPFSGVRDRVLRSLAVIDLEKLTIDLTDGAFKVWGSVPWDGAGWEVSEEFAKKWWFLMDGELLRATNFWRRQRLEPSISASDILLGV